MRTSPSLADQREYRQVLAQVNFVAVKRLDGNGRLAVAAAIPWTSGGVGRPFVLLGLWYLGMLAAEDSNWALNV